MHAAVVKISIDAAQAATATEAFNRDIFPRLRAAPGLVADYWLEPAAGAGSAYLVFDTEEEARAATPPQSNWAAPGVTVDAVEYRRIASGPAAEVNRLKKYETVVSSGQSALRALLTMNAGAVVVFLTFISHLWDNRTVVPEASLRLFVWAFAWFVGAIVLTLMSYGAIFITNCYSSVNRIKASDIAFRVTVWLGIAALVCFITGGATAIVAFRSVAGSMIPPP